VDGLAGERVGVQSEAVVIGVEVRMLGEQMSGEPPELLVEAVQDLVALDAHFLHDFLVEVVEEFLAGVALAQGDLGLHLTLELVEFKLDLFRCAALLVNGRYPLLEAHARLHRAEYLVAGAEHAAEEAELLS
jgi:hypothetical protein